jgi:hypothetical protein
MNKLLYDFFTTDHRRVEALLDEAAEDINAIRLDIYHQFRVGILTHIKMEEKVLFPAAQKANGNDPIPLAAQLRLEHGAITSLMVPPPSPILVRATRHILDQHDLREEEPGGMYDICEALTRNQTQELLEKLRNVTPVSLLPHNETPYALEAARRALLRAGYDYDTMAGENRSTPAATAPAP